MNTRLMKTGITPAECGKRHFQKPNVQKTIKAFCEKIEKFGYIPGVYASSYLYDNDINTKKLPKSTVVWVKMVSVKVSEFDETNSTYYWYSFVPDETAVYNFESHYTVSDNTDPVIYLCDKNKNEIADHDDIGGRENRNFRLKTSLIKGETYYLYFREYNDLTSFEFSVDKTKINFSFTFAKKHTLTQGCDSNIRIDDNGDEYDYYNLDNVIYSEGNIITETKEDGTKVTYICKKTPKQTKMVKMVSASLTVTETVFLTGLTAIQRKA